MRLIEPDYMAPSKDCGEHLGIDLHCDWGLSDHAGLQKMIYACPNRFTGDSEPVQFVASLLPNMGYRGRQLFDFVMGCVSQFNLDDILYFLDHDDWRNRPSRIENRSDYLRIYRLPQLLQWVPSEKTLDKIEEALGIGK